MQLAKEQFRGSSAAMFFAFLIQERKKMPSFPSVPKTALNFHLTQVIRLILVRFISQSSSEEVWLLISAPQCLHPGKKTKPHTKE